MSCYLKPKPRQRKSHTLQKKMLKFEANSLSQRTKLLNESEKNLEKCWEKLCTILKKGTNPEENDDILSRCVGLIVEERVNIQRQGGELKKIGKLRERCEEKGTVRKKLRRSLRSMQKRR